MRQSSRIYFVGKDHKDIYFQGHYHDKMYIGSKLVWEKLKGGEYIFDFEFKYYSEDDDFFLTAVGYPLNLNSSNSVSIPVKSVRMADVFGSDYRGGFSGNFFVTAGKSEYVFITEDSGTYTIRRFKGGKVTDTITFTVDSGEDYYYRDFHSWFSADGQYNFYLISKKTKGELGGYDYFVYTIKGSAYSKQTFTIDTFCDKEIFSQNDGNKNKSIFCDDIYYYDAEEESLILGIYCRLLHNEEVTVKEGLTLNYEKGLNFDGFIKLKGTSYEKLSEEVYSYEDVYNSNKEIIDACPYILHHIDGTTITHEGERGYDRPYSDFPYKTTIEEIATKQYTDPPYSGNTKGKPVIEYPAFIPYVKNAIKAKVIEAGTDSSLIIPLSDLLDMAEFTAFHYGYFERSEKWLGLDWSFDFADVGLRGGYYCSKANLAYGYLSKELEKINIYGIEVIPEINIWCQYKQANVWFSRDSGYYDDAYYDYYFVQIFQYINGGETTKDVRNNSPFDIGISFSGRDKLNIKTTPTGDDISSQEITFGGYTIPEYFYTLNNIKDVKQYNGNYYFYANSTVNLLNTGASIGLGYTTNIYIDTEDNLRKEAAADENG